MRCYEGIPALIDSLILANRSLSINTSKDEETAQKVTRRFLGDHNFKTVVGHNTLTTKKPDPAGVEHIAEKTGVSLDQCVYVGDSEVDIETGRNAGIDVISVAWGFRTREELIEAGATTIVESPSELYDIICR